MGDLHRQPLILQGLPGRGAGDSMASILLPDDEALVQMMLAQVLEDAGHTAIQGRTGEPMREDLARGGYDLVITDLNMPVMTGWDVAKWIKEHRPGMRVLAISGRLVDGLDQEWTRLFDAVFPKPVDEQKLLATIAGLVTN
jgi:CheY-like chemotaxis protein